jgi:tetratricopeptide (TPR) repeat protein
MSYVPRPALEARLDQAFERRLTTVVAGPGFGKTTTVAGWSRELECAWYTLDSSDDRVAVLARGLADALSLGVLAELPSTDEDLRPGALASVLCEALDHKLQGDLFLVLDDLHEVSSAPSVGLIEALCRQAPSELHLVLSSRAEPPFPIERLRGRGHVTSVGASELAFSVDDVRAVLGAPDGGPLVDLAEEVREVTAGWPAAVRLAAEALRGASGDPRSLLASAGRRGGSLFSYLAKEVFEAEPESVSSFLRTAAVFERSSVGLHEALGVPQPGEIVADLESRTLFVQRHGGDHDWFTVHALAREFVLARWPLDEVALRELHRRAAGWFEESGHLVEALRSLLVAGDTVAVAGFLHEHGENMKVNATPLILDACGRIPPELWDQKLETLLANVHLYLGDRDSALAACDRALRYGEPSRRLAAVLGALHSGTDLHEALHWYARARLAQGEPEPEDVGVEVMVLQGMASVHFQLGEAAKCREVAGLASDLAARSSDARATVRAEHALAVAASLEGDLASSELHYRREIGLADDLGDTEHRGLGRNNLGSILTEQGRIGEAIEEFTRGLEIVEAGGTRPGVRGLLLQGRAESCHRLGRLDEALVDYATAQKVFEGMQSAWEAGALAGLGLVHAERGAVALARALCAEAAVAAERLGNVHLQRWALSGLASVLAADEPDEAVRTVERAIALGSGENEARPLIAAAWIELSTKRGDGSELVARAEAAARRRRDLPALAETLVLRALAGSDPRYLGDALEIWRTFENRLEQLRAEYALARLTDDRASTSRARQALERLGIRVESAARVAGPLMVLGPERPPRLAITTLGGFAVLREGTPVPLAAWQSKKARDLLKLLVGRLGHPVPRDRLMETLWPGEDPDKAANRLAVALSTLRSVLDPAREFSSQHFVHASKEAVALQAGRVVVDVEAFLADAEAGRPRRDRGSPHPAVRAAGRRRPRDEVGLPRGCQRRDRRPRRPERDHHLRLRRLP